jgi:hypothetical protein
MYGRAFFTAETPIYCAKGPIALAALVAPSSLPSIDADFARPCPLLRRYTSFFLTFLTIVDCVWGSSNRLDSFNASPFAFCRCKVDSLGTATQQFIVFFFFQSAVCGRRLVVRLIERSVTFPRWTMAQFVSFDTSMGSLTFELYVNEAPKTV